MHSVCARLRLHGPFVTLHNSHYKSAANHFVNDFVFRCISKAYTHINTIDTQEKISARIITNVNMDTLILTEKARTQNNNGL